MATAANSHLASFREYAAPEGINAPPREGDASQIALQGQTDRREVEVAFNGRTPPPHRNPLICNQNGKFVSVQWERKAYGMAEDLQSGQTG